MEELASQFWPTAGPLILLLIGVIIAVVLWVYREDRERIKRLEEGKASKEYVGGVHEDVKEVRSSVKRIEDILMGRNNG